METDQFCPKCGAKVIKEKRCPECGEVLRDGVKFCPGCGRAVEGRKKAPSVSDETLDIPIEAIERNILSETAAKIKAEPVPRRTASTGKAPAGRVSSGSASGRGTPPKSASARNTTVKRTPARNESAEGAPGRTDAARNSSGSAAVKKKQASVPAPPPRRKKPVYREEVWEEEDWEDEDDWEEDDWDDDDWDDEEEGIDAITIMTVVAGCILLIVVAVLGFHLYRQYMPKNYDRAAEQEEEEAQEQEEGQGQPEQDDEAGGEQNYAETEGRETYTLMIDSNVNVRDQPSTSGTNVLKVAKAGETYTCYGTAGDGSWYEIVLEDGTTAYVFKDYVSIE